MPSATLFLLDQKKKAKKIKAGDKTLKSDSNPAMPNDASVSFRSASSVAAIVCFYILSHWPDNPFFYPIS